MRWLGLLVTATAVPMIAACGAPPRVPEWNDGKPAPAAPSVSGAVPALDQPAATAAPNLGTPPAAPPEPGVTGIPPAQAAPGERFLAAVRGRLPEVAVDRRPEEITEIGAVACTALAAGQPRTVAAAELTGYGMASTDARELVSLARTFLCRN